VDHVAWQIEVANNEEWEELTKLQGLVGKIFKKIVRLKIVSAPSKSLFSYPEVVDVYSEWCGPCTAMASHLKEIKLQLGDDFLHCALVSSSSLLLDCVRTADNIINSTLRLKRIVSANSAGSGVAANPLGFLWL
jgi:thiol-disulfide isomerase/thioredoxin